MKMINKFLLVVLVGVMASCASFTDGLTTDPNAPTDADALNMIQGPMVMTQFFHAGEVARLTGIWTNHFTGQDRQYVALNDWNAHTSTDSDSPWGNAYYGVTQCRLIQAKADVELNPRMKGIAQVLEAHMMGTVTSLWGDVPFSEAIDDSNPNPAYDAQEDVYAGLQTLLDDAIINLNAGGAGLTAVKDIFYAANYTRWIQLANALKARYYLHVGDYTNANTYAQLGMQSAADDMVANFGNLYGSTFNPFYSFMVYDRPGYMGAEDAYAPNLMDPDDIFSDPYNANRNHSKQMEGARYYYNYHYYELYTSGYEPNYLNGFDWGCTNCGKFGEDMRLVTYAEMLLIRAEYEARVNGLTAGVAAYNTYRALMATAGTYWTTTLGEYGGVDMQPYVDGDFAPGGLEDPNSTASDPVNALLREIYEERYVFFAGSTESFVDMNRTNNIAEIQLKDYDGVPQRLLYPQDEVNTNTSTPNPIPDVLTPTPVHNN